MDILAHVALFLHLVAFAAYLGAGFAQQRMLAASVRPGIADAARDEYERNAAMVVTKIELPAIFTSVVSGALFFVGTTGLMRQPWLHAKLTIVLVLLVLSHLEMFNARNIVRARERGDASEVAERKKRHALMGAVGSLCVVILLGIVCFWRTA